MSEDNLENLHSIEDLVEGSELPSVEEFIEKKKDWWCTCKLNEYANPSWFKDWLENK